VSSLLEELPSLASAYQLLKQLRSVASVVSALFVVDVFRSC
jgi:hypothetical protein